MNVMIDLKTLFLIVLGIALLVLIVYLIQLTRKLLTSMDHTINILEDVATITDLAAKRSKDVDGIIGDVSESVESLSKAVKGDQNIFSAISSVIKAVAAVKKAGKRILLERIGVLWKRMKFLHKVSARNIFRYKKRMIMMILGIGGCTALVLAGFGIYDSVGGIAQHQYSQIEKYDMAAAFSKTLDEEEQAKIESQYGDQISNMAVLQQSSVDAEGGGVNKSCNLMISDDSRITKAVSFRTKDGRKIAYPKTGEAVINNKLAEMLSLKKGDQLTVKYDDTKSVQLTVSGIYWNYVSNYIYINGQTYEDDFGKTYDPTAAFLTAAKGTGVYKLSENLNKYDDIIAISINKDIEKRVSDMMVSLNYIVILVIGCAGALAFIVLFNLGNINLTERVREIATIEVLGFYPREMGSYVFRENFILVLIGIVAGLPTGYVLHKFIMSRIVVDAVSFNEIIEPASYVFTVLTVIGFSVIVDLILRRKMRRINMAEALKSIE
mgnify:CR=1 FL=1